MAVTAGQFTITFDKVNGVFILTDITDYSGQSKPLTDVVGNFRITSPTGGVIHLNTSLTSPDIDADVSLVNNSIVLPLDSLGDILCGNYIFEYTIHDFSDSTDTTVVSSVSFTYKSPEVSLSMPYDCAKPELKSQDETNYFVDGVLPSAISYNHTLHYPATSGATDITSTSNVIVTNTFFTLKNVGLQHSSSLVVDLTYVYPSYGVVDQISGNEYVNVICDPGLCDLFCGLLSLWNKYVSSKGTKAGSKYLESFTRLTSATSLIQQAYACGKTSEVPAIINEIKLQGNFAEDCCCDDDSEAPVLVTGVGNVFDTVIQQGTGIVVTSSVSGNITTYVVSLDPSVQSAILSAGSSVVSSGLGVAVTPNVSGSVTTYQVRVVYGLSNESIPVYNNTTEVLEDSSLSYDGTVLSNSGDLNFERNANTSIVQGSLTGGDDPEGNILEHKNGTYTHRVVNGEYVTPGFVGSGFDVLNGANVEGCRRIIEDGVGGVLSKDSITDGTNLYFKQASKTSMIELLNDGSKASSINMLVNSVQVSSDSFVVNESSAPVGALVSNINNTLMVRKETANYSFSLGFGSDFADQTNTVIGSGASGLGFESTVIGSGASDGSNQSCIVIGAGSNSDGEESVVVGDQTTGTQASTSVGFNNDPRGEESVVLGRQNSTLFARSIAVGNYIGNTSSRTITMGFGDSSTSRIPNADGASFKVAFGVGLTDTVLHIGTIKQRNYMGGNGTFEFSSNFSDANQNSKWNFHDGDIEVVNVSSGIIVKAPNSSRWRITVDNTGNISTALA